MTARTHTDETPTGTGTGRHGGSAGNAGSTLGEVSHTNPYTDEAFGDTQTYDRGKIVAADGGRADAAGGAGDDPAAESRGAVRASAETLSEVSHTPPGDATDVQAVHDCGVADE